MAEYGDFFDMFKRLKSLIRPAGENGLVNMPGLDQSIKHNQDMVKPPSGPLFKERHMEMPETPQHQHQTAAGLTNEDVLRKIEAYTNTMSSRPAVPAKPRFAPKINEPAIKPHVEVEKKKVHHKNDGRGQVESGDDGRLRENRDKEHAEIRKRVEQTEGSAGDSQSGEATHEKEGRVTEPSDKPVSQRRRIDRRRTSSFAPEELAIRNHVTFGVYANKILGPESNPSALPTLYSKVKDMQSIAASSFERDELQKYASQVASLIFKHM